MSKFQEFFMDNFEEPAVVEKKIKMGGKLRDFKFQAMPASRGDEIRKKATKTEFNKKTHQKENVTDEFQMTLDMIAETIVEPNLKDTELQANWGVVGEDKLLEKMKTKMTAGEWAILLQTTQEINGFNDEPFEELKEEAKN